MNAEALISEHEHWFTSLWESASRDATEHVHPCIEDLPHGKHCPWVVIGAGRSCDGKKSSHRRVKR